MVRKLFLTTLMAGLCCLGISSTASAFSVNLNWLNAAGGPIDSVSGNSVTLASASTIATLTLDISITTDSRGTGGFGFLFEWDRDLGNELDFLSGTGIPAPFVVIGGGYFAPLAPTYPFPDVARRLQESTAGGQEGIIGQLEAALTFGAGTGGFTVSIGTVTFVTTGSVANDGDDVFSNGGWPSPPIQTNVLAENFSNITSSVAFGGASVNYIPEPGTLSLLGLGVGALVFAGRRRKTA